MEVSWDSLHGAYSDTCIIIANGTGLTDIPVAFLKQYPTFGTNKIFLLPDFTSTFYVVTNPLVFEQNKYLIVNYHSEYKFSRFEELDGLHYRTVGSPRFSKDPRAGLNEGYTVTHICLQIAYWLGFGTVLIVGLDHYYHSLNMRPNATRIVMGEDKDHFSKDYFPPGTTWQTPDLKESEISFKSAMIAYHQDHRAIYNVSTWSFCKVFPKLPYQRFMK